MEVTMNYFRQFFRTFLRYPIILFTGFTLGCAVFTGYSSLSPQEKSQYQEIAERMSVQERMDYLKKENPRERQAYLQKLDLGSENAKGPTMALVSQERTPEKKLEKIKYISQPAIQKVEPEVAKAQVEKWQSPEEEFEEESKLLLQRGDPEEFLEHEKKALAKKKVLEEKKPSLPVISSINLEEKKGPEDELDEEVIAAEEDFVWDEKFLGEDSGLNQPIKKSQKSLIPLSPVRYSKSGDPVTDIMTLLDLYEEGTISQEQFDHEKDLALQGTQ